MMKVVAIDDEKQALKALKSEFKKAAPKAEMNLFYHSCDLLNFAKENPVDIAFLDIVMKDINGIELAKLLKKIYPMINIIFVTGHSDYAVDAFSIRASGYLMKPVQAKDIKDELKNLRNPLIVHSLNKIRVQTFGNFEVFIGDTPLHFKRSKSKELFAYLIDRKGASVTMAEIAAVLWEDKTYGRSLLCQIHTFISEIKSTFIQVGVKNVILKERNSVAVNVEKIDCDYYKFLEGDFQVAKSFIGEYMSNYTWAEFTVGSLSSLVREG